MDSDSILSERTCVDQPEITSTRQSKRGMDFWLIVLGITMVSFIAILESSAVSMALPTIVSDLHADQFLWVANGYGIASTFFILLSGGLADIFGHRLVMLGSLLTFTTGAAISGAAQSMGMLIAGRVVCGAGSGGIFTVSQKIIPDLVPPDERGPFYGLLTMSWAVGSGIGPVVGGALSHPKTWRWLFYLNIPVSGLAMLPIIIYSRRLPHPQAATSISLAQVLDRLDWLGNILVMGASCSVVIALTWGGVQSSWHSAQVLVPLCLGITGMVAWFVYERTSSSHPTVPKEALSNWTSVSGYVQIFIAAFVNGNLLYYLPVYYQASQAALPLHAGAALLGLALSTGPAALLASASVRLAQRYRPQLWLAWALILIGAGLASSLTAHTRRAPSVWYQLPAGAGLGAVYALAYYPVLAPLLSAHSQPHPVSSARAAAFFAFVRSFGMVWGVTAGGAALQNEVRRHLSAPSASSNSSALTSAYALIPLIPALPQPDQDAVRAAFARALATVFRMVIAFAGVGLLASLPVCMKDLPVALTAEPPSKAEQQYSQEGGEQGKIEA